MTARTYSTVKLAGRTLRLSNLDKVLYPQIGFTKGQVIDYYTRIAPVMLPHLRDRPVTLKRYPEGVEAPSFFEKNCPSHKPAWLRAAEVRYDPDHKTIRHCFIDEPAALAWSANLAALELHTSLATAPAIDTPTMIAFDLDPGPPADLLDCMKIALVLRDFFEELGLKCLPKTSGGKGLHLYIPLNNPRVTYDTAKPFAQSVAQLIEQRMPDRVVSKMARKLRGGKVFIDWSQNSLTKTTVCVYALRARARPTVSTPITWEELERALRRKSVAALTFEAPDVLKRVDKHGDLFADVLTLRQRLPTPAAR